MSLAPVDPQSLPQMTWFIEPSTNNIFAYSGIDLGWLEFSTGGNIGPANGLKFFGSNIGLGGTLTDNTVIQGLGGVGLGLTMYNSPSDPTHAGIFGVDENGAQIATSNYTTQEDYTILTSELNHQVAIQYRKVTSGVPRTSEISLGQLGMIVTDDNFLFGLKYKADYSSLAKLNNRWIPDYGAVKSYVSGPDSNVVHLIGYSNQRIDNGLQIYDESTLGRTMQISGQGIQNGDYQITTNGANAFFNTFLRNGVSIVGVSGNTIVTFNDHNIAADNPDITFYFPVTGTQFNTTQTSSGSGDNISIFTNNIVKTGTAQGLKFTDINNTDYSSIQHTFKDLLGNTYLTLGNGSDGPLSEALHLRITNAPTDPVDAVRLEDLNSALSLNNILILRQSDFQPDLITYTNLTLAGNTSYLLYLNGVKFLNPGVDFTYTTSGGFVLTIAGYTVGVNDQVILFGQKGIVNITPTLPTSLVYSKTVSTYALMEAEGTPLLTTEYRVLVDENKGDPGTPAENTLYKWYPDGKRLWVAAVDDN